jgi:hypothetical protein
LLALLEDDCVEVCVADWLLDEDCDEVCVLV